jgi:RND family efflux transporter MFP subunit
MEPATHESSPAPLTRILAIVGAIVVLVGLGGFLALRLSEAQATEEQRTRDRDAAAARAGQASEVAVIAPAAAEWQPRVALNGTLEPIQAADLAFEVGGRIERLGVSLGDRVEAGELLVVLDRAAIGAQTAQTAAAIDVAEAQVRLARDRLQRVEALARGGAAADSERVAAQQGVSLAEAQLAQARAIRRSAATASAGHTLVAPFAGMVTRVPPGTGAVVGPGIPILRIEDLSSLKMRATVGESEIAAVREGATVRLLGSEATGTVRAVVRSLDAATRRAPIEVLVPNADGALVGNAFVRAEIRVDTPVPAVRIPGTARRADGSVLVVTEENRIEVRPAVSHVDDDGSVLVVSGLATTDRVVVRPHPRLLPGTLVRPIAAAPADATPAPRAESP